MKVTKSSVLAIGAVASIALGAAASVAAYPDRPQAGPGPASVKAAEEHFDKAIKLFKQHVFQDAVVEYQKVVQLVPGTSMALDAQYWIGQTYYRMGRYDEVLSTLNELIEKNKGSAIVPVSRLMVTRVQQEKENSRRRKQMAAAMDQSEIVDPKTGAKFTKVQTITGRGDVVLSTAYLTGQASYRDRFLLYGSLVIPLDGGNPFDVVNMPAFRGRWSPDGNKVAFYSGNAIWVAPVNRKILQAVTQSPSRSMPR